MHLPPPVQTYFDAEAPRDGEALAAAFHPDAIVRDEGHRHRGPAEIRAWWLAAKEAYRHRAEPLSVAEVDATTVVEARVTGEFPGSPALLTFAFTLRDDRIVDLKIG